MWTPGFEVKQRVKSAKTCRDSDHTERLKAIADQIGKKLNASAYRLVHKDVHAEIDDLEENIHALVSRGFTYEQISLRIIGDYAGGRLETGWYHGPAGRLRADAETKSLFDLFLLATRQLVRSGLISMEQARRDLAGFGRRISSVGPACEWPKLRE